MLVDVSLVKCFVVGLDYMYCIYEGGLYMKIIHMQYQRGDYAWEEGGGGLSMGLYGI